MKTMARALLVSYFVATVSNIIAQGVPPNADSSFQDFQPVPVAQNQVTTESQSVSSIAFAAVVPVVKSSVVVDHAPVLRGEIVASPHVVLPPPSSHNDAVSTRQGFAVPGNGHGVEHQSREDAAAPSPSPQTSAPSSANVTHGSSSSSHSHSGSGSFEDDETLVFPPDKGGVPESARSAARRRGEMALESWLAVALVVVLAL